jgi:hypothetical protein
VRVYNVSERINETWCISFNCIIYVYNVYIRLNGHCKLIEYLENFSIINMFLQAGIDILCTLKNYYE